MGALVTLGLPDDSPTLELPWIITFGPLGDEEEWEPVVCGPYERNHALGLAETVVADENLLAVVEPLLPHASVEEIRAEIAGAREAAEDENASSFDEGALDDEDAFDEDFRPLHREPEYGALAGRNHNEVGPAHIQPGTPPSPAEVRAGIRRIAARLTSS